MSPGSRVSPQVDAPDPSSLRYSRHAQAIRIRGVVQGVGFRPFVFRIAQTHGIRGWVLNDSEGVRIHAEGSDEALAAFNHDLTDHAPQAACIDTVEVAQTEIAGYDNFRIQESESGHAPTAGISPDLPVCAECIAELSDPADRRNGYEYINCTNCGPRYSIIRALPYDRSATTMAPWQMCAACTAEYADPADRRFHAQPNGCQECGPRYALFDQTGHAVARGSDAIMKSAALLADGKIVAVKGIGGYHLACDANRAETVAALRERKFRKEQAFAVMVRDIEQARRTVELSTEAESMLESSPHPIVVARGRIVLEGVAPDTNEIGVMLPYTPLHHQLFAHGAPSQLVMTSANRSSEPLAYRDDEALDRLSAIADAFLIGERPIARRVDDSVVRIGAAGPMILRRSRGYSPGVVARFPDTLPILAVGGDLKSTITLVRDGRAIMSQHIGDLSHFFVRNSFRETISDLTAMYDVDIATLRIAHDMHPDYVSTAYAREVACAGLSSVQHHRAHVASVLAEHGAFDERVIGVAFDGTGYGDDGTIWGGEFFAGSVIGGLQRVGHLRSARLPGGDAAARYPVQAAAGFLAELDPEFVRDMRDAPFYFPDRFRLACELVAKDVRCFATTSAGRLFDTVAALLGFTREITYEGQAAIWLERLARSAKEADVFPISFIDGELDFRATLVAVIEGRRHGRDAAELARAFHRGLARGICDAIVALAEEHDTRTAVLSGGVFQNDLLLSDVLLGLAPSHVTAWTNMRVPPNDGGLSLGQAALAISTANS